MNSAAAGRPLKKRGLTMSDSRQEELLKNEERMTALLNHEKPDRVPLWPLGYPGFAATATGMNLAAAYSDVDVALDSQRLCCEKFDWVHTPLFFSGTYPSWEFGGEVKLPEGEFGQAPLTVRHPVREPEDLEKLSIGSLEDAGFIPLALKFTEKALEQNPRDTFFVRVFMGGPFSFAGNLCGPELLCKWLFKDKASAEKLLKIGLEHTLDLVQMWKKHFGTERIMPFTGEPYSSNQLISPKMFREYSLPIMKELQQNILDMGFKHIYCHICGEQNANLADWAEVPMGVPGIVSIGHEIDVARAAEVFPNDIIAGNLNPTLMVTGQAEVILEQSREIIAKGKACPGGFAFSPGCELPTVALPESVQLMTQAVLEHGWY